MTTKTRITKNAFVLAQPRTMPAHDVVAAAEREGIALSPAHVHAIRYKAKKGKTGRAARRAGEARRGAAHRARGGAAGAGIGTGSPWGGLIAEIERIVERVVEARVTAALRRKLGEL